MIVTSIIVRAGTISDRMQFQSQDTLNVGAPQAHNASITSCECTAFWYALHIRECGGFNADPDLTKTA